jgi:hypothetical protein
MPRQPALSRVFGGRRLLRTQSVSIAASQRKKAAAQSLSMSPHLKVVTQIQHTLREAAAISQTRHLARLAGRDTRRCAGSTTNHSTQH